MSLETDAKSHQQFSGYAYICDANDDALAYRVNEPGQPWVLNASPQPVKNLLTRTPFVNRTIREWLDNFGVPFP